MIRPTELTLKASVRQYHVFDRKNIPQITKFLQHLMALKVLLDSILSKYCKAEFVW